MAILRDLIKVQRKILKYLYQHFCCRAFLVLVTSQDFSKLLAKGMSQGSVSFAHWIVVGYSCSYGRNNLVLITGLSEISLSVLGLFTSSVFQLPLYKMGRSIIVLSYLVSVSFFTAVLHVTPVIHITTSEWGLNERWEHIRKFSNTILRGKIKFKILNCM